MPTARPFARNTGAAIAGATQVGNLAVGTPTAGFAATGLPWWNGPDEEPGYVIATQVAANNQPTPVPPSVTASVGFWRSSALTDASFISLAEYVSRIAGSPQIFATPVDAHAWLTSNGYWTSYNPFGILRFINDTNYTISRLLNRNNANLNLHYTLPALNDPGYPILPGETKDFIAGAPLISGFPTDSFMLNLCFSSLPPPILTLQGAMTYSNTQVTTPNLSPSGNCSIFQQGLNIGIGFFGLPTRLPSGVVLQCQLFY